jgi:drug/metabolite transporter (DMT)-like permease
MMAAGACSAGAVLLIRDIPKFAGGMPPALTVAIYMLLGGVALLVAAMLGLQGAVPGAADIQWPSAKGFGGVALIGILLALLELFFVFGARQSMPMPEAMIVYNVSSVALLAIVGVVVVGESMNWTRLAGIGLGIGSMILLLQPAKS